MAALGTKKSAITLHQPQRISSPSRLVQNAKQQAPEKGNNRGISPMAPFSLPMATTDSAIGKRHGAAGNQDPAQGPAIAIERSGVDGQAHEDVPHTVDRHEAVDHLLVRGQGWGFEFEELEGTVRADYRIDAESHEDGGEDAGGNAEGGRLGEGGGGHCVFDLSPD